MNTYNGACGQQWLKRTQGEERRRKRIVEIYDEMCHRWVRKAGRQTRDQDSFPTIKQAEILYDIQTDMEG